MTSVAKDNQDETPEPERKHKRATAPSGQKHRAQEDAVEGPSKKSRRNVPAPFDCDSCDGTVICYPEIAVRLRAGEICHLCGGTGRADHGSVDEAHQDVPATPPGDVEPGAPDAKRPRWQHCSTLTARDDDRDQDASVAAQARAAESGADAHAKVELSYSDEPGGAQPPSPSIHHQEAQAPVAPSPPAICSTCGGEGAIWQPGLDAHGVHWGIQCNACEGTGRLLGPPSPLAWEELGLGIPPADSHDAANTCDPDEATNSDDGGSDGTSTPAASHRANQQCRFCCPECHGKGHLIRPASPPLATECDLCHGEGGGRSARL